MKPPAGMSPSAKRRFLWLVSTAEHRWEHHHRDTLELYCETRELLKKQRTTFNKLTKPQMLIERSDGQQQVTPLLNVIKDYTKLLRELAAELGLSPVSETRAKLEKPIEESVSSDPLAHIEIDEA